MIIISIGLPLTILISVITVLVINNMIYISIGQYSDIVVESAYLKQSKKDCSNYHCVTFDELQASTKINAELINQVKDFSYQYRYILIYRVNDKLASRIVNHSIRKLRRKIIDEWDDRKH